MSRSFDSGFALLQDLFPQVDPRLLKAVAIEHSKDVEAAVEFVISEVLPSICISPKAPHTLIDGEDDKHLPISNSEPPEDAGHLSSPQTETEEPKQLLKHQEALAKEIGDGSELEHLGFIPNELIDNTHHASEVPDVGSLTSVGEQKISTVLNTLDKENSCQLSQNAKTGHQEVVAKTNASLSELAFIDENNDIFHHDGEGPGCSLTFVLEENSSSSLLNAHDRCHPDQLHVEAETEEHGSLEHEENVLTGLHQGSHALPDTMMRDDVFFECNDIIPENSLDLIESEEKLASLSSEILPATSSNYLGETFGLINCVSNHLEEARAHDVNPDMTCLEDHFTSPYCETLNAATANEKGVSVQLDSSSILAKTQEYVTDVTSRTSSASDSVTEKVIHDTKLADYEDRCFSKAVVNESTEMCRVDFLEDAITEAKNNKKTLFTTMDSVTVMMREVEDLEKAAEHAKEEAFRGGRHILAKVEDLKKMLLRAKEANDMHAGEVYGEKAILATEARELQSRLQNLSYERDRSLSILNEMRRALEARMAAADEERKTAEQDKLNKEGSAGKALMEQELDMEQVVQDSKRLHIEAEENSKLREFLIDRGRIVDILQGEMAVICKDVDSLKENFENQVPVSKILSSSQTSSILASSGSSSKCPATNLVSEQVNASEVLSSSRTSSILASSGSSSKSLEPSLVPEQVGTSESPKSTSTAPLTDSSWENGSSEWKDLVYKEPTTNDDDWNFIEDDIVN